MYFLHVTAMLINCVSHFWMRIMKYESLLCQIPLLMK